MRNIKLDPLLKDDEPKIKRLYIGLFYQYYKKPNSFLRPKSLIKLMNKVPKGKNLTNYDQFISDKNLDYFMGSTLQDLANFTGNKLVFYAGASRSSNITVEVCKVEPDCVTRETHFLVPALYRSRINPNFLINKLPNLTLVQNQDALRSLVGENNPQLNLTEWIADKSGKPLEEVENLFEVNFGDKVDFQNERKFTRVFGFGFQVSYQDCHDERDANQHRRIIIPKTSYSSDYLNLEFIGQWPNRTHIYKSDVFRLTSSVQVYSCPNPGCKFKPTHNSHNVQKHLLSCTMTTKINYRQVKMTEDNDIREYLIKHNFLEKEYQNTHFATYDLESFAAKENSRTISDKSKILSEQKIVTAAFSSTFGSDKCIKRNSLSKVDHDHFHRDIADYIDTLAIQYRKTIPEKVLNGISSIQSILSADRKKSDTNNEHGVQIESRLNVYNRAMLTRGLYYLKKITTLKIYGYNSENYDMPLLLPGLLSALDLESKGIQVVKRGTGLMKAAFDIDSKLICFLDGMNYFAGGSLDQIAKKFGATVSKGIFPYELYESISAARLATRWPKYEFFRSSLLKRNIRNIDERMRLAFEMARTELSMTADLFLDQMSIPSSAYTLGEDPNSMPDHIDYKSTDLSFAIDPVTYIENMVSFDELLELGVIGNMYDYLGHYNILDCIVLKETLQSYVNLFIDNLSVNPLDFYTLPGMAERIMWSKFDDTVGSPFSLNDQEYNELIHEQNKGGSVIVAHRHVEVNVPIENREYHESVYSTPNGETIAAVQSHDMNNLYGKGVSMEMPVGRGIEYRLENGYLVWKPLHSGDRYSREALVWLNYMQSKFLKEDGSRHVIRHAMNHGETVLFDESSDDKLRSKMYKPDGYLKIDDKEYFFEYDGCHFHECPHNCPTYLRAKHDSQFEPRSVTERNAFYESRGQLFTITSCEWNRIRNTVGPFKNYTSIFFNRKNIRENEIFEKIKSGDFFGLVLCDVRSPEAVKEKFSKINFPPVFCHLPIEETMIHPDYLQILKDRKTQFPLDRVLTLTYKAKNLLLTTETAKFYMELGLELSNITKAYEYEKAYPLAHFVKDVTEQRKAATRSGNKALQDVFKLVMNSSYGVVFNSLSFFSPTSHGPWSIVQSN